MCPGSRAKALQRFTQRLERDLDAAVITGLSHTWNSGVVKGHVNRIKMLKRQRFGCAGFELLRKRVLLAHAKQLSCARRKKQARWTRAYPVFGAS